MSIQFSDTTNKKGLVQFYEKEIGANYGDVSGNATKLAEFVAQANLALDNYLLLWAKSAGTWEADDINHTDFQIVTTNIVSGQRDYQVTVDGSNNRIFDISKVLLLGGTTATAYDEIYPIDELKTPLSDILLNTVTGVPYQYGKMGNSILLDPIPSYSVDSGIKAIVNREGSYFQSSDTTKIPGVPAYHEYFYKKPAHEFAKIHSLSNLPQLEKDVIDLEGNDRLGVCGKISAFFGSRERDISKVMTHKQFNFR